MGEGRWVDCSNCRHERFFSYGKTYCRKCELDPVLKCYVCGKEAKCSGAFGYLCHAQHCINSDDFAEHRKISAELEEEGYERRLGRSEEDVW